MYLIRTKILITLFLACSVSICISQGGKKTPKNKGESSTVKGRLVQHESKDFEIDLNELKTTLYQNVKLPEPPVPKDEWPKMSQEQRVEWVKKYEAGDAGKKFLADRKKIIESAQRFELEVEDDGSFVVYDVLSGVYGLRGGIEKKIDEKTYVFEVFGQIEIKEDVEEVLLDPISVTVTRLLNAGENIPQINITTFDGKAKINNQLIAKHQHNVLVSFWSLKSPPSLEQAINVQKTFEQTKEKHKVQLLSVCIDSKRKEALAYVRKHKLRGWHGFCESWDHEMLREFGVRVIPALYLLDKDGTIKLTDTDIQMAFRTRKTDLSQIVIDSITGKKYPVPTPIKEEEGSSKKED